MYVMTTEPISAAYFINPSTQSLCPYVYEYTFIVARKLLGKHVPAATNTHNDTRIIWGVLFYAIRDVSEESRRLVLPRTSC
jgi:hypothetical protein